MRLRAGGSCARSGIRCGHDAVAACSDDARRRQCCSARRDARAGVVVVVVASPAGTRTSYALAASSCRSCCRGPGHHRGRRRLAAHHRHSAGVSLCTARGAQTVTRSGPFDSWLLAQKATTWPETGIGLAYSRVSDAHLCWSRSANYYVAVHTHNIAGTKAMTLGDIVLTPGFDITRDQLRTLTGHEARHRAQWAVGTVIGGPLAFPVAYAIDDFFFPGSRNHFERLAGLSSGGYRHSGTGPVLGPAQLATLGVLAAIIVVALLAVRRRRFRRDLAVGADTPGAGTDRNDRRTHA
jgi:hypothetical protein